LKDLGPRQTLSFLELGCETGRRTEALLGITKNVHATELTQAMVNKALLNAELASIIVAKPENSMTYPPKKFDAIFILGKNIYCFDDITTVIKNTHKWLSDKGILVVQMADRNKFDPIPQAANLLPGGLSVQKYRKERKTDGKVVFKDDTVMTTEFALDKERNRAIYTETFKFKDGQMRSQIRTMKMPHHEMLIDQVRGEGYNLIGRMNMARVGHPYEFLMVFKKDL